MKNSRFRLASPTRKKILTCNIVRASLIEMSMSLNHFSDMAYTFFSVWIPLTSSHPRCTRFLMKIGIDEVCEVIQRTRLNKWWQLVSADCKRGPSRRVRTCAIGGTYCKYALIGVCSGVELATQWFYHCCSRHCLSDRAVACISFFFLS